MSIPYLLKRLKEKMESVLTRQAAVSPSTAADVFKFSHALNGGVDLSRDSLLTAFGHATLADRYINHDNGESSPQHAFMRSARAFSDNEEMARRIYDYASRGWFMFSTPVLANAPHRLSWGTSFSDNFSPRHFTRSPGLPISCFLNEPGDSRIELNEHYTENAMLSSIGGGIGAYWGNIRSNGMRTSSGSKSAGMVPFVGIVDRSVLAFAQGTTRRASYAAYIDISHPEIMEFLELRKPTGGDANRKSLNLHNGVCIPDAFMEIIERCIVDPGADDTWELIDPKFNIVTERVSAKALWEKILELRAGAGQGEPYIFFTDTVNRALPETQKRLGLRVKHSNLCTEITLATSRDRTAVCCLSSANALTFDEWKDNPLFIPDLVRFLDNVLEYFIQHGDSLVREEDLERTYKILRQELSVDIFTDDMVRMVAKAVEEKVTNGIRKAVYSASQERSIGIGLLGFHSYLQKNNLPFESAMATVHNRRMFSHLKKNALAASMVLADERGECPDALGTGVRNMHLLAVAPNASSSIYIPGRPTSPSIEPYAANAFTHKTQSGSWLVKNPFLEDVLAQYGRNDEETWRSIILNKGSCQHLDFLTDDQKDVFKTFKEIDQRWIIEHAAHRQESICQSQSVNLAFPAGTDITYLHAVHFMAWKRGLKTLYYVRSEEARQADKVSVKISREQMVQEHTCLSCEG